MPGLGNADGVTPGRRTVVTIRRFPFVVNQHSYALSRPASQMGASSEQGKLVNCEYIEGKGIILKSENVRAFYAEPEPVVMAGQAVHPREADQILPADPPPASIIKAYSKRADNADLTRAGPYAQRSDLTATHPYASDETAFPGPASDYEMVRMFVGTETRPFDTSIHFTVWSPGSSILAYGPLARVFFNGPADSTGSVIGSSKGQGIYCIEAWGDGHAKIYERDTLGVWIERTAFRFAESVVANHKYHFTITSDLWQSAAGTWFGRKLLIQTSFLDGGATVADSMSSIAKIGPGADIAVQRVIEYVTRSLALNPTPIQPIVNRTDVRKDIKVAVGGTVLRYVSTGTVYDGIFRMPFFPDTTKRIRVELDCKTPADTSVTLLFSWFDDNGAEHNITAHDFTANDAGIIAQYDVPAEQPRDYRVKAVLATTNTLRTPVIPMSGLRVFRDPVIEQPSYPLITLPVLPAEGQQPRAFAVGFNIDGPGDEPTVESSTIQLFDLTEEYPELKTTSGVPCDIEVIDTATGNVMTNLHHGIIQGVRYKHEFGKTKTFTDDLVDYPTPGAVSMSITTQSEWNRFARGICMASIPLVDADTGQELKVSDALVVALNQFGYPFDMIDIPDHPVKLDGEGENRTIFEEGGKLSDMARGLAKAYTSGTWIYDTNAGTLGAMWRLVPKKKPPYKPLMRFYRAHPGAGKLAHDLAAYPTTTVEGQTVLGNFLYDETLEQWFEPPEGNQVVMHGYTKARSTLGGYLVSQTIFNPASANFFNLASSHAHYPIANSPDFLGEVVPIHIYTTLNTSDGDEAVRFVNWIARRVFDTACYGRNYMKFVAPLRFVWDQSDPYQYRARKLQPGDIVQFEARDGTLEYWVTVRCSPIYTDDNDQKAVHEFVRPTSMDEFGAVVGPWDLYAVEKKRAERAGRRIGHKTRAEVMFKHETSIKVGHGVMIGYPVWQMPPIQIIDPADPDFGKFIPMADYD